jgi:hypothetical protein
MFSRSELTAAWEGVVAHRRRTVGVPDMVGLEDRHAAFLRDETRERLPLQRVPVLKAGGSGVRWLDVVDPDEEALYRAATARVVGAFEAGLGREVVANRVADPSPKLRLEPWRPARHRFRAAAARLAGHEGVVVLADVRDCYPSIEPHVVERSLSALGCDQRAITVLMEILGRFCEGGVRGLPVGPEPSAVLANAVLSGVDRALAKEGYRHLRWVDDFVVAASDRGAATRILERLRSALAEVGLEIAPEKSGIEDGPGVLSRVLGGASGSMRGAG